MKNKKNKPRNSEHPSLLNEHDVYLFKEGTHHTLYNKFGSHRITRGKTEGTYFAVWAPNAESVSVIGDFNQWQAGSHPLRLRWDESGIWEGYFTEVQKGNLYKYHIVSREKGYQVEKSDPYAIHPKPRP